MVEETDLMQPQQQQRGKSHAESGSQIPNSGGDHSGQDFEWVREDYNFSDVDNLAGSLLNIHFVAETGQARPQGVTRNLIRSHARRGRTKRSRVVAPHFIHQDEDVENRSAKQHRKSRKLGIPTHHRESMQDVQLNRDPGNNAFDTFSTLPLAQQGCVAALINHYEKVFRHSYAPVHPREKWLSFAVSDPAVLSATLFTSALSLCLLRGKSSSTEVVYYLGETIRQINRSLSDPMRRVTDANIAAVTCLTLFESLSGSVAHVKIHADGLETMVKSRGGLQNLGGAGLIRRLTTWVDCVSSIVMESEPRFELFNLLDLDNPPNRAMYSSLAIRYKVKLFNLTGLRDLSDETIAVYWDLRKLSALKEVASCRPDRHVEMAFYSDTLELLERRVIQIARHKDLLYPATDLVIYHLFADAVILHIYLFMRDLPRGLPFFHLMSSTLRQLLECLDVQRFYIQYPEMMLWILVMGGLGAIGTSSRTWFASLVAEICSISGLRGVEDVALILEEFLWCEMYRSPVTSGFWNDVAEAQGIHEGYEVRRLTDHVAAQTFNAPPDIVE